jgi:hypothetical protein
MFSQNIPKVGIFKYTYYMLSNKRGKPYGWNFTEIVGNFY